MRPSWDLVTVFQALGDPTRREIPGIFEQGEQGAESLVSNPGSSSSTARWDRRYAESPATSPLSRRLVLEGGTCLRMCCFPGYRFSDDLNPTAIEWDGWRGLEQAVHEASAEVGDTIGWPPCRA